MKPEELIKEYSTKSKMMQLATAVDSKPWISTVYFVVDETFNFYWLSLPTRRHSREIEINDQVAITVPVKVGRPVIGIQSGGKASVVKNADTVKKIIEVYTDKYDEGREFYEKFKAGTNEHQLYVFEPDNLVLFDEVNFLGGKPQEIQL
jgi:uncharacterized protein YhbP (UPF0306 family)